MHQQIRDRGAVGNTPAIDTGHALASELPPEFGEKPRLADAGLADNADGLPVPAFDLTQEIVQDRQVALPVDERRTSSCGGWPECGTHLRHFEQAVGGDRIGFAFENEGSDRLHPRVALRQLVCGLAQKDRRRLGRLLKSGGDIAVSPIAVESIGSLSPTGPNTTGPE